MGIGAAGAEQFRDAIVEFRNQHIIAAMSPLLTMRSEIVGLGEFKDRTGFQDTTQSHLLQLLQSCDKWRRVITYNPEREDLGTLIKRGTTVAAIYGQDKLEGQDPEVPLKDDPLPYGGDEVQSAAGLVKQVPWALDGTDTNIPLNSMLNFRSNQGFLLLQAVDAAIVAWTRLESRFRTRWLSVMDSMRMYGCYVEILEYLHIFGGDENRVDVAAGVRPSEEPRGAANSPNMASEVAGSSGIKAPGK